MAVVGMFLRIAQDTRSHNPDQQILWPQGQCFNVHSQYGQCPEFNAVEFPVGGIRSRHYKRLRGKRLQENGKTGLFGGEIRGIADTAFCHTPWSGVAGSSADMAEKSAGNEIPDADRSASFFKKTFRNYDEMNAWKREYLQEIAARGGIQWKRS